MNEFLTYTYQRYLIFIQNSVLKKNVIKFIMARETISEWKVSLRKKKTRTVYATQRSFSNINVLFNKQNLNLKANFVEEKRM